MSGMQVYLFETSRKFSCAEKNLVMSETIYKEYFAADYKYGVRLTTNTNGKVLVTFNARNEHDRSKFVDDLKEAILEVQNSMPQCSLLCWRNLSYVSQCTRVLFVSDERNGEPAHCGGVAASAPCSAPLATLVLAVRAAQPPQQGQRRRRRRHAPRRRRRRQPAECARVCGRSVRKEERAQQLAHRPCSR